MSAVTLQIAIMVTVLGPLVWLATRRSRSRSARRTSGDSSWTSDAAYSIADAGQQHDGSGGTDSGAGGSGDSGGGDSGGGDGGGGGSSD